MRFSKELEIALCWELKNKENIRTADLLCENGLIEYAEMEIRKTFKELKEYLLDHLFNLENTLIDGINTGEEEQQPSNVLDDIISYTTLELGQVEEE